MQELEAAVNANVSNALATALSRDDGYDDGTIILYGLAGGPRMVAVESAMLFTPMWRAFKDKADERG